MTPVQMTLESAAGQATGWALVHFLWQGTIVALIAASALRLMNRQSAGARYLVACLSLLVLAAFPLATAWRGYEETSAQPVQRIHEPGGPRAAGFESASPSRSSWMEPVSRAGLERVHTAVRPHLPWLVGVWLAGVALLSIRLLAGWFAAQRLCRNASVASSRWQRTLRNLSARMNLGAGVRLLESTLVEVPMVIGWLRPVVLVPVTAMTGLTPVQLETILAHELAHIRRHDYLINVLQSVVEILFFYHPAVWWLSNRIRVERENCCDDVAVSVCGNPLLYARALAGLEELRSTGSPALAVNSGSLRERVTRLVSSPRLHCSYRWVTGVSILSLIAALTVAAPLTLLAQQSKKKSETRQARAESSFRIVEENPAHEDIDVYAGDSTDEADSYDVSDDSDDSSEPTPPEPVVVAPVDDHGVMPATAIVPFPPPPPAARSPRTPKPPVAVVTPSSSIDIVPPLITPKTPVTPRTTRTPRTRITPTAPPATPRVPGFPSVAPVAVSAPALAATPPGTPAVPRLAPHADDGEAPARRASRDRARGRKNARWDGQLTVDQLIELRTAGVDAAYINELRKLGYGNLSFDDLIALRLQGVDPQSIASMNAYGFGHLTADQLMSLRNQGVTAGFIDQMKKLGYGSIPVEEFISLRIHGITPEYVKQMNSAGFGRIPTEKLLEMRLHGVDPVYISQLAAAGYPNLRLDDVIQLRIHGVNAAFIKTLKEAGLDQLDIDQIIRLRNSGVDPEFIREIGRYRTR